MGNWKNWNGLGNIIAALALVTMTVAGVAAVLDQPIAWYYKLMWFALGGIVWGFILSGVAQQIKESAR